MVKLTRRSLFSLAVAAPSAAALQHGGQTEPSIVMRPQPECCGSVMVRLDPRFAEGSEYRYKCFRCERVADVPPFELRSVPAREVKVKALPDDPKYEFTWTQNSAARTYVHKTYGVTIELKEPPFPGNLIPLDRL